MGYAAHNFQNESEYRNRGLIERLFGRRGEGEKPRVELQPEERFALRHGAKMQDICAFLADAGLDPTPDHYELGWHYVTAASAEQRKSIEASRRPNGRIEPHNALNLLDQIRTTLSEATISTMVEEARERIGEARATTEQSSRDAATYGASLGISLSDLENPDMAKLAIERLQRLTSQMIERTARAEAELKRRSKSMAQLKSRLVQSQKLAMTDALTDLPNRRAFDGELADAVAKAARSESPLSIGFCDIDHFKKVNDSFGHATGDRVICHVAEILKQIVGVQAHVARHGGEEFALLFPSLTADKAAELLDTARERLASRRLVTRDTQQPIGTISFSAGVAEWRVGEEQQSLLAKADQALYDAKSAGRNRVFVA
jgi:diguanylate cyclase